jgi:GTP-binding protein
MDYRKDIRNVAIIAHVDHGKTTLVDALLKQSKLFRDNDAMGDHIMDQNALERERHMTILAKNTAVVYRDVKINIIDTPGHVDFSGEVERVISMADGALLLIDSADGPMPQTKSVLRQALNYNLKIIVIINKVDKPDARISEAVKLTQDLFLELATNSDQLDFPVLYASGREGYVTTEPGGVGSDVSPLFECILKTIPPPRIEAGPFQMMISNLDYDVHKGKIAIGRIWRGKVALRDPVACIAADGTLKNYEINELFTYLGLKRIEIPVAEAGDIVALTGISEVNIGDTIASPDQPEALPRIEVGEPTVEMTFGVNTSPFAGREGRNLTSRQLRERLYRELETNLSLRVQDTDSADTFLVKGRGELHLAILIETMRREGFEFEVSKPEAITRMVNGQLMEPVELLSIDTNSKYIGVVTEMLSKRQAQLTNMHSEGDNTHFDYKIPTRGLIGFRTPFLTATRGENIINTVYLGYEPVRDEVVSMRMGVLVASEEGKAVAYGLNNAQGRGLTFIEPGTMVYEGMIIGLNQRQKDIAINVCKEKKLTNVRFITDVAVKKLISSVKLSLEQGMDFINKDELLEVTPENVRMRKKILTETMRLRAKHRAAIESGEDDGDEDSDD